MKKILFVASFTLVILPAAFSQTWTGTSTPTSTTGKAALGTTTYENSKLTIRNIQYQTAPTPNQAPSAVKIMNGYDGAVNNVFEIWNGTYQTYMSGPGGPSTTVYNPELTFWVSNRDQVGIKNSLRIGSTAANGAYANYKLSVAGDMIAKRCVIQVDNWADYVFADEYSLPTLNEVQAFINDNKHLPGVPSESDIKNDGLDIGAMNKILMQKVEELTLYLIDMKKQNEDLKTRVENLETKM